MVIQHNIAANNAYRNLSANASNGQKNLEKLSSGYRINRSADDAAGLAISEQMRSKINGLDQATSNANDAIGLIQTAEGALTETHSMLQRMVTLATQSANGTYNSTARGAITEEVTALKAELNRIASTTDYNGVKPLNTGNAPGAAAPAVGGGTPTPAPAAGGIVVQIGPTAGETLTIATAKMGSTALGVNAVDVSTVSKANSAITTINKAINSVSTHRAKLGASQNRLEHTINNLKTTNENMTAAESRIRDTDMAKEMAAFTKNNILNQAAQSMLSQANQQPQGVLSLLR